MKSKIRNRADVWIDFTVADHLPVQQQVERRACRLWQARGCPERDGLSDWLRAEREVLTESCVAYEHRLPIRSASLLVRKVNAAQASARTTVFSRRPKTWAYEPREETTALAKSL